jgi:hypothetical protein
MDEESIKKELKLLAENIMEVLESTAAVKGEQFAGAVGVHLECCQMIEAIGGLVIMARYVDEDRADYLYEVSKCILASVASKACGGLEKGQLSEALSLAQTLYDRRQQVSQKLRREMRDD